MRVSRSLQSLLILGLVLLGQSLLSAPASATAACDPEFRKSLEYRGWQELQREIQVNEKYILKPDSVFALSCFGDAVNRVPSIFSQAPNTSAVTNAMSSYGSNFGHGFFTNGSGGSQNVMDTSCGRMQGLWNNAAGACRNFPATIYASLKIGDDPRSGMSCGAASWSTASGHLNNVGGMPLTDGTTFDTVKLFLSTTDPLSTLGGSGRCSAGIPTGVKIGAGSGSTIEEVVCGNPGCVPYLQGTVMKCCDQNSPASGPAKCQP